MAKSKKQIVPFFRLRFQIGDTLEAISHEILMTLQALETAVDLGEMNEPTRAILKERAESWRKLCMVPDDE